MHSKDRNLSGLKVLIIEDEAMIAMLLEDLLCDLGCEVVATASRYEDALAKASTLTPDVALLDVNLDGKLSLPIAATLGERKVPFVYATAYGAAMPEDAPPGPILSKPFGLSELKHALGEIMSA